MRIFKLINSIGNEFDLMRKDAFFLSPDGLGLSTEIETVRAGRFYFPIEKKESQKNPTGTMIFKGYAEYKEFLDFIRYTPLQLGYKPIDTFYFADCEIARLDKAEIGTNKKLSCPIDFMLLTPYFTTKQVYETVVNPVDEKKYTYSYPYNYYDSGTGMIELNVTEANSPIKLHIFGACTNPQYSLVQNDKVIASGKITIELTSDEKLIIDANPQTINISKCRLNNEVISDAYENSDFTTERFLYAPIGESYITFSDDTASDLTVIAEVSEYADSV